MTGMPQIRDLPAADPIDGGGRAWTTTSALWTADDGLARLDPTAPTEDVGSDTAPMLVEHRGDGWFVWPPVADGEYVMGIGVEALEEPPP